MTKPRALLMAIVLIAAAAALSRSRATASKTADANAVEEESAQALPKTFLKSVLNQIAQMSVVKTKAPATPVTPDTVSGSTQSLNSSLSQASPGKTPAALARKSQDQQEQQSIETLTSLLSDVVSTDSSPARLVTDLIRAGYEPAASRDADPVTGSMIVIQTKNTLPGSRYFRAQYFSDEDGNYQPQHISFELRPGTPQAVVTQALTKAFGGTLPAPSYKDSEWTSYKLPDGYSLWTKVLNANDVQENAIFAHSPEDIGTTQVAIEKDIAGHEDEP